MILQWYMYKTFNICSVVFICRFLFVISLCSYSIDDCLCNFEDLFLALVNLVTIYYLLNYQPNVQEVVYCHNTRKTCIALPRYQGITMLYFENTVSLQTHMKSYRWTQHCAVVGVGWWLVFCSGRWATVSAARPRWRARVPLWATACRASYPGGRRESPA